MKAIVTIEQHLTALALEAGVSDKEMKTISFLDFALRLQTVRAKRAASALPS
jgi:hypothetical protein